MTDKSEKMSSRRIDEMFSNVYDAVYEYSEEDVMSALSTLEPWQVEFKFLREKLIVEAYNSSNLVPRRSLEAMDCCETTCQKEEKKEE